MNLRPHLLIATAIFAAASPLALKLAGFVAWPWWLVLAPIWVPLALAALLYAVFWTLYRLWPDDDDGDFS